MDGRGKDIVINAAAMIVVCAALLAMVVLLLLAVADFEYSRRDYSGLRVFSNPSAAPAIYHQPQDRGCEMMETVRYPEEIRRDAIRQSLDHEFCKPCPLKGGVYCLKTCPLRSKYPYSTIRQGAIAPYPGSQRVDNKPELIIN